MTIRYERRSLFPDGADLPLFTQPLEHQVMADIIADCTPPKPALSAKLSTGAWIALAYDTITNDDARTELRHIAAEALHSRQPFSSLKAD